MKGMSVRFGLLFLAVCSPLVACFVREGYTRNSRITAPNQETAALVLNESLNNDPQLPRTSTTNRRDALLHFQASLLALNVAGSPRLVQASAESPKTILVTGANSGIGLEACKRIAATQPQSTLLLACRTIQKAQAATETIGGNSIPLACDLSNLASIAACVQEIQTQRSIGRIDTLCLNAGLARNAGATDCLRTVDGWELTIGVNHVGHFYLRHLLQPLLAPQGRIVITASGVHDPESPGGAQGIPATLGDLQGLVSVGRGCEMIDGGAFNGDKAYKDSKVCHFVREVQRHFLANMQRSFVMYYLLRNCKGG